MLPVTVEEDPTTSYIENKSFNKIKKDDLSHSSALLLSQLPPFTSLLNSCSCSDMGCTASKLDNEDTVRRCKDRRRLIKEAVFARHNLAAAHADYCRSLRLTGSALCAFAAGEPLSISDQTPAVFLHCGRISPQSRPNPPPSTAYSSFSNRLGVPSPSPSLHPPPPPPFSPSPNIASSKLPHILSASSISSSHPQRLYRRRKLPHNLSESSPSSPRSQKSNFSAALPTAYPNSTYSSTHSQTSSVWNWENFYPPSPPNSEFFQTRAQTQTKAHIHYNREEYSDYEDDTDLSEHKFFTQKIGSKDQKSQQYKQHKHHLDDSETDREEVQCSEWDDRYSSTASSDADEDGPVTERNLRSEMESQSNVGSSIRKEPVAPPPPAKYSEKFDDSVSSMSYKKGEIPDMRMVVRHKDLKEIVEAIRENFEKAAEAGDGVSEILEIGRAQLDRSFRQLKKTVYHSFSVLSNLSSSWTSKPPLAIKYRLDTSSLEEPGAPKSFCSTLERLLAWEKKLYEEVKARERGKFEHEKKLSALQSQEYRGEDEIKLDKTKASIKRLQSVIIVTSQAVSTTSTAINGLRDSGLIPQLVELCHGFMYMWRSMHQYHDIQNNIIQQVRGLINRSTNGDSTSELHRQATRDLESSISAWHSSFCRLIKFQRDFIQSLHGWFKLSFVPLNNESSLSGNKEYSDIYAFCDEWKLALDRVPDMVASEAIKSFINVVHAIAVKQSEEIKVRKRTETASKELERKASSLRNIEKKFYNSYSMTGIGVPHNGHALDAHDPLAEKKSELIACQRRVEDEMMKHSKAVEVTRSMTLNNLQTGLPGVFQALTSFAALFSESLESVCTRSYAIR